MFIPLSQQWMAGHGSLEISLERPLGASTWIERVVVYSRSMHAIKALSSVKFGTMPRSARGPAEALHRVWRRCWRTSGSCSAHSPPARSRPTVAHAGRLLSRPWGRRIRRPARPGRGSDHRDISQLLVRGQAIEARASRCSRSALPLLPGHCSTPWPVHASSASSLAERPTRGPFCSAVRWLICRGCLGSTTPELEDMYGKVQACGIHSTPPARSELRLRRLPGRQLVRGSTRQSGARDRGAAAQQVGHPAGHRQVWLPGPASQSQALVQRVVARQVPRTSRWAAPGARDLPSRRHSSSTTAWMKPTSARSNWARSARRSLRPQNWWMEFVSHQRDRTLEEVFQRHDEGLAKTHEDERQARIRAWDEGRQAAMRAPPGYGSTRHRACQEIGLPGCNQEGTIKQ